MKHDFFFINNCDRFKPVLAINEREMGTIAGVLWRNERKYMGKVTARRL